MGNAYGLEFAPGTVGNFFRGNVARDNSFADLVNAGPNTSHGDNYMPNQI